MKERMNDKEMTEPLADSARRVAEAGRETVAKTSEYVRDGLDRAADYAQDLSSKASDQITDLTGRAPEAWTRDLRNLVEQHPMKALLVTIGVGYLLGKMVRRA